MQIPYATKTTAAISGIILAVVLSVGTHLGGSYDVICSITGLIWFPVSIAVFVHGKQAIDKRIECIRGLRPHTDVPKDITPRALIWFCSTLVTAWALSLWLK